MKEFFAWYMIASLIGVWTILAYGFYRISRMDIVIQDMVYSKANVRSVEISITALDKDISKTRGHLHAEITQEMAYRLESELSLAQRLSTCESIIARLDGSISLLSVLINENAVNARKEPIHD